MRTPGKLLSAFLLVGASVAAYATATNSSTSTASSALVVVAATSTPMPAATVTVGSTPVATSTSDAYGANSFTFGIQTHFSQGWNPSVLNQATQVGATTLRDTVNWASAEKTPGVYDFSSTPVATLTSFCARGGKLILTIVPQNLLYDHGVAVNSIAGRQAYANYIAALLTRFGGCVSAIEVGNEVNNSATLAYPSGMNKAATYVETLNTLYTTVKPRFPAVAILGGSTNAVGTGFLQTLFAAGALHVMDGVAVHPYRTDGEGLDFEINHLREVMKKYGTPVPIWATEFSYDTTDLRLAASGLVKSAALLSASGVDHASWYALIDQSSFPNMGLFTGTAIKPTGTAYMTAMQRLFANGRATKVATGDNLVYLYRFGADRWLVWGAPRTITFAGSPVVRDVLGVLITGSAVQIGAEPRIVEGATGYTLGDSSVVADTLLQWGSAPWSYFRRGADNKDIALGLYDNDYTSWFGDTSSKPLRINNTSGAPAGDSTAPMRAVLRYTSPKAQQIDLDACFSKALSGDGVDYKIERNGVPVISGILLDKASIRTLAINLAAGDRVDISFGPNQTYGGDSFSYRAILSARGRGLAINCN